MAEKCPRPPTFEADRDQGSLRRRSGGHRHFYSRIGFFDIIDLQFVESCRYVVFKGERKRPRGTKMHSNRGPSPDLRSASETLGAATGNRRKVGSRRTRDSFSLWKAVS